jgi:signal transduction histidine kinase
MAQSDKQDTVIHAEADNAAEGTAADSKLEPNDAEENMRALVAQYEARIDEVADLIARVRHEINNPLAGVLGQAQLLLREELSEKARKRAETIEQMASRVRDIVAQLRQVQRISRG